MADRQSGFVVLTIGNLKGIRPDHYNHLMFIIIASHISI